MSASNAEDAIMQPLPTFEHELYQWAMNGRQWIYVPRAADGLFGLAIVAVGEPGKLEVPLDSCCSERYQDMRDYADRLNARYGKSDA